MPSPRDITGDLARLHHRPLESRPSEDSSSTTLPLRKMAFDPLLWIAGALLATMVGAQFFLMGGSLFGLW